MLPINAFVDYALTHSIDRHAQL